MTVARVRQQPNTVVIIFMTLLCPLLYAYSWIHMQLIFDSIHVIFNKSNVFNLDNIHTFVKAKILYTVWCTESS